MYGIFSRKLLISHTCFGLSSLGSFYQPQNQRLAPHPIITICFQNGVPLQKLYREKQLHCLIFQYTPFHCKVRTAQKYAHNHDDHRDQCSCLKILVEHHAFSIHSKAPPLGTIIAWCSNHITEKHSFSLECALCRNLEIQLHKEENRATFVSKPTSCISFLPPRLKSFLS